jgi:hypothetical protein
MSKYAYMPFTDPGLLDYVTENARQFHKGTPFGKIKLPVMTSDGAGQPLKAVKSTDQLYVYGHGAPKSDALQDNAGNEILLTDLAALLLADGLSLMHKKLKLFSCNGGVGQSDSMAAQLKRAMQRVGFRHVIVYGYTDSMLVDADWGPFGSKSGAGGTRAKSLRVKF